MGAWVQDFSPDQNTKVKLAGIPCLHFALNFWAQRGLQPGRPDGFMSPLSSWGLLPQGGSALREFQPRGVSQEGRSAQIGVPSLDGGPAQKGVALSRESCDGALGLYAD